MGKQGWICLGTVQAFILTWVWVIFIAYVTVTVAIPILFLIYSFKTCPAACTYNLSWACSITNRLHPLVCFSFIAIFARCNTVLQPLHDDLLTVSLFPAAGIKTVSKFQCIQWQDTTGKPLVKDSFHSLNLSPWDGSNQIYSIGNSSIFDLL